MSNIHRIRGIHSAAVLVLALWAISCRQGQARPQPPAPRVVVAPAERRDLPLYTEVVGTVDGYINAELRARVRGILQAQHYQDGGTIKEGQLLFTIDRAEYEASVDSAKAALGRAESAAQHARTNLARRKELGAARVVSQQELEDAEAAARDAIDQVRAARAQLRQAALNLSYPHIRSPVPGIAGIANVRAGNLVGGDAPTVLATVSQIDPIRVTFPMSEIAYVKAPDRLKGLAGRDRVWAEAQFARMARGLDRDTIDRIDLVLADGSIYPHKGVVVAVNRQVDPTSGTITVEALFPNPNRLLRPGQFGRVRMLRSEGEGEQLVVPERAIVQLQGADAVAVVSAGDKVQMRTVQVGPSAGGWRVVTSGLVAGEKVVVEGVQRVSDGATVVASLDPQARAAGGTR